MVKFERHPQQPKRPLSPFLIYSRQQHALIKAQNPDKGPLQFMRIISQRWKQMNIQLKSKYQAEGLKLKQQYDKDLQQFKSKYGQNAHKISLKKSSNIKTKNLTTPQRKSERIKQINKKKN